MSQKTKNMKIDLNQFMCFTFLSQKVKTKYHDYMLHVFLLYYFRQKVTEMFKINFTYHIDEVIV